MSEPTAQPPDANPDSADEPIPVVTVRPRDGGRAGTAVTAITLGLVALLLVATLVGRWMRAPPMHLVLAVTFLPYLYVALVVWVFGLWSAVPDQRAPPVMLGALLLSSMALWGPSWGASGEQAEGLKVRAMTWNVRRLWGGPADGGDPKACVEAVIREQDPDVLTLLEVSQLDLDRMAYELGFECVHTTYQGTGGRQAGGLASCVRGDRWTLRSGRAMRFVDEESWSYVFAEVEREGRVLNVLSVHLYPYDFSVARLRQGFSGLLAGRPSEIVEIGQQGATTVRSQGNQSRALLDRVQKFADPTLVAGDFNSVRDLALHRSLRGSLTDAWEQGGQGLGATVHFLERVPLRVDYLYATDDFAVSSTTVPAADCSDHRPVVADLVLRGVE